MKKTYKGDKVKIPKGELVGKERGVGERGGCRRRAPWCIGMS